MNRIWIARSRLHGLFVDAVGSTITATDTFVLETRPKASNGTFGWGASATTGSRLELERVVFERNSEMGAGFSGPGTQVRLRDLIIEHTAPGDVVGPCGRGLNVQEGVHLTVDRARIEHNREVGLVIHDPDTVVQIRDLLVDDTSTVGAGILGSGIGAQLGAHLSVERAMILNSHECGVFSHDAPGTMDLTDVVIANGMGTPLYGNFGRGINVQTGAAVTGTRVLIEDNREAGVVVANAGSSASFTDLTVRRTIQRLCVATTCAMAGAGSGIVVRDNASASVTRFLLQDNYLAGAQISDGATIDLMDGDVVNHPVGVNVQTMGFDMNRILDNVRYIDNAVQVNGASLYVPNETVSPLQ